jgi:hypothetical protein
MRSTSVREVGGAGVLFDNNHLRAIMYTMMTRLNLMVIITVIMELCRM